LIDNALNACETAGVTPHMEMEIQGRTLAVRDNGPGLASHVARDESGRERSP
jgi:DNA topoisomerase VI subunit B